MTASPDVTFSIFSVHDHYPALGRTVAEYYAETLEQCVLAEALGFDTFWFAEHHFHEYGTIPNPAVMMAAAAMRTARIRLGTAVSVLTFHHPLLVAEDYAMVDVLSGGRLVFGTGSGYLAHEFAGFKADGASKRQNFDQKLAVIEQAWSGEPVTAHGEFVDIDDTRLNVTPLQRPTPPIAIAALRAESAYHIGRQGRGMLAVPYATVDHLEECRAMVSEYERGWADGGRRGPAPAIGFAFHTFVAESDAEARAIAEQPFMNYVGSRLYGKSAGWDEITERRYCLFGGVDAVVERVAEMREMGIRHILALIDFGGMPYRHTERCMRLLASEVMPRFGAGRSAA